MNCPTCPDERLVITDRRGIEVDYCPACRGIWLDRGELDKLLERAEPDRPPRRDDHDQRQRERGDRYDITDRYDIDDDDHRHDPRSSPRRRRRRGMLSDLLDFG